MESKDKWTECPECGCKETEHDNALANGFRVCVKCKQEWWADIDYSNPHVESFRSRVIEELEGIKKDMEAKIKAVDTSPNFGDNEKHMIKFGITMGIDSAKSAIERIKNLK
jgi:hypothetical protein